MREHESVKKLRKSSLILRALQEIFLHDIAASFRQVLISVTQVYICDKSRIVKVYVSFMPSGQGEKMIQELNKQKSKIRGLLGNRLANKLRSIPELSFYIDHSLDRALRIEKLIKGVGSVALLTSLNCSHANPVTEQNFVKRK